MKARLAAVALLLLGIVCLDQQAKSQLTLQNVGGGFGGAASLITLVSSNNGANCTPNCSTVNASANLTLTGTHAGNLIIVGVGWCINSCGGGSSPVVNSVMSSNSGSGETCSTASGTFANGATVGTIIAFCQNIVGGNDTISIGWNLTAVNFQNIALSEWSGANTSTPNDSVTNNNSTANSLATNSIATAASTTTINEIVYSYIFSLGSNNVTCLQTAIASCNGTTGLGDEYQRAATTGTYTNTTSSSVTGTVTSNSLAAFKK